MTDSAINRESRIYKEIERIDANRRAVRIWLLVVLFVVFCLVLVGGATRLTDSGLSITEWKPIHGVVPPLTAAEWDEEFRLYQRIPEYSEINKHMTVEEFKGIFWWEWAHRLIARSIGVIFAVPLFFFWVTGRLERRLKLPLLGILALGGVQGAIGWWMVASGLSKRVDVSQYRLAIHLTVACLIFAATTWVWRALCQHSGALLPRSRASAFAGLLVVFVLLQIYLGALVAGLDAGLAYNTWPLMDGAIVPSGLDVLQPLWLNAFENAKAVQFLHRMNAYILLILALLNMLWLMRAMPGTPHANRGLVFFLLVVVQAALGIMTLLFAVPLDWALAHQGCALLVLGFSVAHWRGFYGEYPRPTDVEVRG
ncbi:COX15/CtaA family protein [Rhizobium sp. KVB221]|uniref:Heme A synthase n=1 Tax=Rhizobium setariae TaxID=2801340 RepID=A0A936YJA2_9HYPH|nr:COX15/CtaA family protein [Rhizobium setariae]MBL0371354.1 COX15/CtaA family protein [Rhizobium setariae]